LYYFYYINACRPPVLFSPTAEKSMFQAFLCRRMYHGYRISFPVENPAGWLFWALVSKKEYNIRDFQLSSFFSRASLPEVKNENPLKPETATAPE